MNSLTFCSIWKAGKVCGWIIFGDCWIDCFRQQQEIVDSWGQMPPTWQCKITTAISECVFLKSTHSPKFFYIAFRETCFCESGARSPTIALLKSAFFLFFSELVLSIRCSERPGSLGINVPWLEEMLGQSGPPPWRQFLLSSPYLAGGPKSLILLNDPL